MPEAVNAQGDHREIAWIPEWKRWAVRKGEQLPSVALYTHEQLLERGYRVVIPANQGGTRREVPV